MAGTILERNRRGRGSVLRRGRARIPVAISEASSEENCIAMREKKARESKMDGRSSDSEIPGQHVDFRLGHKITSFGAFKPLLTSCLIWLARSWHLAQSGSDTNSVTVFSPSSLHQLCKKASLLTASPFNSSNSTCVDYIFSLLLLSWWLTTLALSLSYLR